MSTISLPDYTRDDPQEAGYPPNPPSYYNNPPNVSMSTATSSFNAPIVKASKTGSLTLELYDQPVGAPLPTFGRGALIRGKVILTKTDTVSRVNVNVQGYLRMQEFAEGGKVSHTILSQDLLLWNYDPQDGASSCPSTLEIASFLPETYEKDNNQFPLPPTFDFQTSGMPGFRTEVVYSITVTMTKKKAALFGNQTVVSTVFVYLPRTRGPTPPANPPSTLSSFLRFAPGDSITRDWELVESHMKPRSNSTPPVVTKLYLPKSRTFPIISTIPFRLHISSSSPSSFSSIISCSPDHSTASPTSQSFDPKIGTTRIYISRQISVVIRQINMFKYIDAGEATFEKLGDGANWAAWGGVITPDQSIVSCGSFKAGGLWVKDSIVLSIIPPSPQTSPFFELRSQTPVRLVTDSDNGSGADHAGWEFEEK